MADEEVSRSSAGDDEYEAEENGIDNEATLDEEEALGDEDYGNELKDLEEEGEMSIEELRRRYGYGLPMDENTNTSCQSTEDESEAGGSQEDETFGETAEAEEEDTEDDKDYAPPDPWRKEVRVNEELYQAMIPELNSVSEEHPMTDPLWVANHELSEEIINGYLRSVVGVRKEIGQKFDPRYNESRDDEDSLCALLRAGYDVEIAKASFPFPHVNKAARTVRPDALDWDEDEKDMFEKAMMAHGKNFRLIQTASPLSYRTMGELIEYYYKWKRTDRFNAFRRKQQQPEEDYREFATTLVTSECVNGESKPETGDWVSHEGLAHPQA